MINNKESKKRFTNLVLFRSKMVCTAKKAKCCYLTLGKNTNYLFVKTL